VGVKGISRLQELVVLEDDKSHRQSGTWERTELAARHLGDARDELFLSFSATYDHDVSGRRCARHEQETNQD
jgi:hypothetical protein